MNGHPMHGRRAFHVLLAAIAFAACTMAKAGRPCEPTPQDAQQVERGMALAEHVQRSLDASGADVVLLARAGQNLEKYGLTYSHLGFAYRETLVPAATSMGAISPSAVALAQPQTVWRIAHKLNACGTGEADIYRQGLGQFFLEASYRNDAAYVVPTPDVQAALLSVLRDDDKILQWHTRPYSMVSYPWATTYQQSNQWALETLAGALDPHAWNRRQAQAWLQAHDYRPTDLRIDALTRLGARMTRANVAFDDHPNSQRFTDHIQTVTVDSMFDWLARSHLAGAPVVVR
jgi:hypothetical protein